MRRKLHIHRLTFPLKIATASLGCDFVFNLSISYPKVKAGPPSGLVDSMEGEVIEALCDNAGQYQEAISRSMADFHTEGYLGNDLMRHFKIPDDPKMEQSIKSKVQSACVTVEASGATLYARLDLSMSADLTHNELDAFTDQIASQYRDGWGAEFELLTILVGKEAVSELNAELDNDGKERDQGNNAELEQEDGETPPQANPAPPIAGGDKPSIRAALKSYTPPAPVAAGPEKSHHRGTVL